MNDQTKSDSVEKIAEEMEACSAYKMRDKLKNWASRLRSIPPSATAQEAVATFVQSPYGNYPELKWRAGFVAKIGDRIYTAPPPQPVSETAAQGSVEFGEALDELIRANTAADADDRFGVERERRARANVERLYALAAGRKS